MYQKETLHPLAVAPSFIYIKCPPPVAFTRTFFSVSVTPLLFNLDSVPKSPWQCVFSLEGKSDKSGVLGSTSPFRIYHQPFNSALEWRTPCWGFMRMPYYPFIVMKYTHPKNYFGPIFMCTTR